MTEWSDGRPDPDQPDAMSMLEVAEAARHKAVLQRNAAADVVRMYAIVAIMQGKNPRDVALASGHDFIHAGRARSITVMNPLTGEYVDPASLGMHVPPVTEHDIMDNFADWLCHFLRRRITGEDPDD